MSRRSILLITLGAIILLIVALLLRTAGTAAITRSSAAEPITWDFRKGPHKIAEVNWPASETGRIYDRKGEFDLTMIGPDGKIIFHERVQHFICERKGDDLENTYVHFASRCSGEQAYQILNKVMTEWEFPKKALDDLQVWHEGIVNHMSHPEFVRLHPNEWGYPGFEAGKAGSVGVRASRVAGLPDDGTSQFTLSLSF